MDTSLLLSTVILIFILFKLFKKSKNASLIDKLPGPFAYPIVGNIPQLVVPREKMMYSMVERHKKYGPIYRTWLGHIPIVHVCIPEYAEVLLSSTKHTRKGNFYRFLKPWLGMGLLTSSGRKWYTHRKMITPTFHFKILESFLDVFNENADILLEKLEKVGDCLKPINIHPLITLCALDIICETAMGAKVNAQLEQSTPYVKSLYKIAELTVERSNKMWHHPNLVYNNVSKGIEYKKNLSVLHGFTEQVIKERKEQRCLKRNRPEPVIPEDDGLGVKKRQAFLDLLLDAAEQEKAFHLTDLEIREEVDTFMFEGHDTTTAAICWTLHSLGHRFDLQEQLQEEFQGIFQNDRKRPATFKELGEMKLLERIIKETLRMYPSVAFLSRKLDEDVRLGDYNIPAETTIAVNIFSMHRNPTVFENPDKFDPDRFILENKQKMHSYAFIPFSAGPRNCIGQKFAMLEEKVILSSILRNFKVESVDKTENLTLMTELILRPLEGIKLKLTKW